MDNKDWKGALSRFESALVLDPENRRFIGVWQRRAASGRFSGMRRANYQKVAIDYDPGSRHGKDAIKALREPEIANAKKPADGRAAAGTAK